jgi:hypothetical protein
MYEKRPIYIHEKRPVDMSIETYKHENRQTKNHSHPVGYPQWAEVKNNEASWKECTAVFVSKVDLNKHIKEYLNHSCDQCN